MFSEADREWLRECLGKEVRAFKAVAGGGWCR
jgi:hypothetical protein